MTIERGMRRVLVVLSVLVTAGWAVFVSNHAAENRWSYLAHHTTVEAYCDPARRSVYEVQQLPEEAAQVSGYSIPGCQDEYKLVERNGQLCTKAAPCDLRDLGAEPYNASKEERRRIDRYLDRAGSGVIWDPTVIIRHAEHRWLREYLAPITGYTLAASVPSVGLLWLAFFTACWVWRGFKGAGR